MITKFPDPQGFVRIRMFHASAYQVPVLRPDGTPQAREVEWYNGKVTVPATQTVYAQPGDDGMVSVPPDVAKFFIEQGFASGKRQVMEDVEIDIPELTPSAPTTDPTKSTAFVPNVVNVVEPKTTDPLS